MKKKEYCIKNTVKDGVIYIQLDEYLLRNIKMKKNWEEGTWLPIMYAYLFVYDEVQRKLDFIVDKVLEGKYKEYPVDKIANTDWVGFPNNKANLNC
jgi:hypothetical protein